MQEEQPPGDWATLLWILLAVWISEQLWRFCSKMFKTMLIKQENQIWPCLESCFHAFPRTVTYCHNDKSPYICLLQDNVNWLIWTWFLHWSIWSLKFFESDCFCFSSCFIRSNDVNFSDVRRPGEHLQFPMSWGRVPRSSHPKDPRCKLFVTTGTLLFLTWFIDVQHSWTCFCWCLWNQVTGWSGGWSHTCSGRTWRSCISCQVRCWLWM